MLSGSVQISFLTLIRWGDVLFADVAMTRSIHVVPIRAQRRQVSYLRRSNLICFSHTHTRALVTVTSLVHTVLPDEGRVPRGLIGREKTREREKESRWFDFKLDEIWNVPVTQPGWDLHKLIFCCVFFLHRLTLSGWDLFQPCVHPVDNLEVYRFGEDLAWFGECFMILLRRTPLLHWSDHTKLLKASRKKNI